MMYLVMKCVELGDQWECDANRTPICITDDYEQFNTYGYEVYEIKDDGRIGECIKDYDEDNRPVELVVYEYEGEEDFENNSDILILQSEFIKNEDRNKIVRSKIFKKLVYAYLDTKNKTFSDYVEQFLNEGSCDDMDIYEDGTVISIKQGNRIRRNY